MNELRVRYLVRLMGMVIRDPNIPRQLRAQAIEDFLGLVLAASVPPFLSVESFIKTVTALLVAATYKGESHGKRTCW